MHIGPPFAAEKDAVVLIRPTNKFPNVIILINPDSPAQSQLRMISMLFWHALGPLRAPGSCTHHLIFGFHLGS